MGASHKSSNTYYKDRPQKIEDCLFYGLELDDEQLQFANAIWSPDIDIVFCNARAGTGKTTIAAGVANLLVQYGDFDQIIYIMSLTGAQAGLATWDLTEKSSVYFEAFYQALVNCNVNPNSAVSNESIVNQKNGTGYISCITDTFLRGSNLNNAVVILDEAPELHGSSAQEDPDPGRPARQSSGHRA